jgi:dihydropyrimidinase
MCQDRGALGATLIRGGTVVVAAGSTAADVLIEGESIAAVAPGISPPRDADVIDATGRLVMPGGIDVHTHIDMPWGDTASSDDFETGTRAAAFGGTTTVIDFANPVRGQPLADALAAWRARAAGRATIDYAFHVTVPEVRPTTLDEIDALIADGVTSFKVFTAYPGVLMIPDDDIALVVRRAAASGALVMVHAEDGDAIARLVAEAIAAGRTDPIHHVLTRPPELEGSATARVAAIAEAEAAPIYVVHLSCRQALDAVRAARARGARVFAETCPQYLFLTIDDAARPGFEGAKYVFSPPVREASHAPELWRALAAGDLDAVATDHCPFDYATQKSRGIGDFRRIPNGLPGVETRLPLLWQGVRDGRLTQERFVDLVATTPARLFGLHPRKGTIEPGADADLVVWDPDREVDLSCAALHMRVDYSPYEGMRVRGGPAAVLSRGRLIVDGSRFLGRAGDGRFIRRAAPFAPRR